MMRIQDHVELRRDLNNDAVIDVDTAAYEKYLKTKDSRRQQQQKVNNMETRINNMEADIADIKTLLVKLLEK